MLLGSPKTKRGSMFSLELSDNEIIQVFLFALVSKTPLDYEFMHVKCIRH